MSVKLEWGPPQGTLGRVEDWRALLAGGVRTVGWVLKFPAGYCGLTLEANERRNGNGEDLTPEVCDVGPFDTEEEAMAVLMAVVRLTHKEEAP